MEWETKLDYHLLSVDLHEEVLGAQNIWYKSQLGQEENRPSTTALVAGQLKYATGFVSVNRSRLLSFSGS